MRKTKIVCTIGPASSSEETIRAMALAGMNVVRLNFSHGFHKDHLTILNRIKKVRKELNLPIAVMLDTKGPEYRIGLFEQGRIVLNEGDEFVFTTEEVVGDQHRVSVNYDRLPEELSLGDTILLNDGLMTFEVTQIAAPEIRCRVVCGGELSDRKSMSFPGKVMHKVYLSDQDKADILFGIENDVDYIACSFVSCKQDLLDIREFLRENGGTHIDLIAKIENQSGVDNIEDICEACEGVMVARGDMGVEVPFERLPAIQKSLITRCRLLGKLVITATEMLESMIQNPRPTRAEISDVANAVYDGTSAIMLSGETAAGKHPVGAVETMAKIAETAEKNIHYTKRFRNTEFTIRNPVDAISHATCGMAIDVDAKAIVACSLSGQTARMVSRFRPPVDIVGLTTDKRSWRKLALSWGVTPALCEKYPSTDVLLYTAAKITEKMFALETGDRVVITAGNTNGESGNTNLIKVEEI